MTIPVSDLDAFRMAVDAFVASAQAVLDAHREKHFPMLLRPVLTIEPGRRYIRIVKSTRKDDRSVYCFVDSTNGDILKSESWKKPAKYARGNIFASNSTSGVDAYGANHIR